MRLTKVFAVLFAIFIMTITSCGGGGGGGGATTDTTAPVVSAFTMPITAASLTVAVTSFSATDGVGVTGYLITESTTAPSPGATGWSASAPTSFTFSSAGSKTAYAWAKDAAGNVSSSRTAAVTITLLDTTAPVVGAFTMPATATSLTVAVSTFSATDGVGVTGYLITESTTVPSPGATGWSASAPTSFTFSSAGSKTAYAWAKDLAGNVSASRFASVTIIIASINTAITAPTAIGTVTVTGIPALTACGLKVQTSYPNGVTISNAVISGITPNSTFISFGTIGLTSTEVGLAGLTPFGSGEVMQITFGNVLNGTPTSNFGATITAVFDCSGNQSFP